MMTWLLILVLIGFSFGQLARFNISPNIAITFLDISVFLLVLFWIVQRIKEGTLRKSLHTPITKPAALFIVICFLSLLVNSLNLSLSDLLKSSLYLVRWVVYVGIYFVVRDLETKHKTLLRKGLLLAGAWIVIAGFMQYFFYQNLRNLFYLGWDDHLYRLFSVFFDPNFTGVILVFYFLYLLGEMVGVKKNKVIYLFLLIVTFLAIFLTHSRTALITLVVGSPVLLLYLKKTKWIVYIGISLIFLFAISAPFFHLENINPFRTASSSARIESLERVITIIQDYPVLGVGFNTYAYAQRKYGFSTEQAIPAHSEAGTDNSWLFVLATTGILGFMSYCYLWSEITKNVLTLKNEQDQLKSVLVAILVGLFISAFFLNTLFYTAILVWIFVLLGLMESK